MMKPATPIILPFKFSLSLSLSFSLGILQPFNSFGCHLIAKGVILKALPILDDTLRDMFAAAAESCFPKIWKMVDLGCSSGPNSLFVISHILDTVEQLCSKNNFIGSDNSPEFEVFLNDLPDNDFNNLFKLISGQVIGCFLATPSLCLFVLQSSLAFSQIPEGLDRNNKENIYMGRTSPPEGLVKVDNLYSFNVPIYMPCEEEVTTVIQNEGSFNLDKLHVFPVCWDAQDNITNYETDLFFDKHRSGKLAANCVRAFMEPMLAAHFGSSIVDELFGRYAEKMGEHLSEEKYSSYYTIVISLSRK
ncbi:UNVERIFIED_CONTAM: Benzoate carboxyl methyltransferase [Sesamum radiatum]|uniref:Benzoate carboxyl methyltransferase n=1 Tax=Sesamum radiatum TaxID=300843 RepID=A0AAW2R2K2_SESRA